jgi:hypothetical protein
VVGAYEAVRHVGEEIRSDEGEQVPRGQLFLDFSSSRSRVQHIEWTAGATTAARQRAFGKGVSEMRTGETHRFYCHWCKRMVWALFTRHGWICSACARPIT